MSDQMPSDNGGKITIKYLSVGGACHSSGIEDVSCVYFVHSFLYKSNHKNSEAHIWDETFQKH